MMAKGVIAKTLDSLPREQRARLKAQAHFDAFDAASSVPPWTVGARTFFIKDIGCKDDAIIVNIEVTENGVPLVLDNPFLFHNPPIMVPDGTKTTRLMRDGTEITVDNFKEDLPEALRQIIVEAVRVTTKKA